MQQQPESMMVRLGRFFFLRRNILFPLILFVLFGAFAPVQSAGGYEQTLDIGGLVVIDVGLAIRFAVIGFTPVGRQGANKRVSANVLRTSGLFAVCRNPLYVGNLLIAGGLFLVHGALVVIVLGLATTLFIYNSIIANEESFLSEKFGDQYSAYMASTNRWVPNFGKLRGAMMGESMNIRQAAQLEYTVGTAVALALTIELWYEAGWTQLPTLGVAILWLGALYLGIGKCLVRLSKESGLPSN